MRTLPLFVSPVLLLAPVANAEWAPDREPFAVPAESFALPDDLEATIWASSPQLYNPTNMDIDHAGRVWVCEGVNYRRHAKRRPGGDRIVVLQDTNGDGKADSSHTFVQEEALIAPLGVAVFDNRIYVSQPPDILVYTDVDRDLKFDSAVDKREVLLTGFNARNHDHSLHSVTGGPDGKLYFNNGNCGAVFTDKSGKTFYMGGTYKGGGGEWFADHRGTSGKKSDDGHVWTSGFTARMNPDGSEVEIVGHGYRNSYEQVVTSRGDMFQNDNDDPPACRTTFILEFGCAGYFSRDGKRGYRNEARPGAEHWQNHWRQLDPGTMDAGDVYGGGSPTGIAYYENGALPPHYAGSLLSCEPARNVVFGYQPKPKGSSFNLERTNFFTSNTSETFDGADFTRGTRKVRQKIDAGGYTGSETPFLFRPSDVTVGPDGALYVCDWLDPRVGGHADLDASCSGTIYRIAPKGFKPKVPSFDLNTVEGALTALKSPAVNTRFLGHEALRKLGPKALPEVIKLSQDTNPYLAARAIWLLPHLGEDGLAECRKRLGDSDPQVVVTAYRALYRSQDGDHLAEAQRLCEHPDESVRREVALSLRDLPAEKHLAIWQKLARQVDDTDKNAVEAIGLGAANQENTVWQALKNDQVKGDPFSWSDKFARLTWRLWPSAAVADLQARAIDKDNKLTPEQRKFAVESLAFIDDPSAAEAMFAIVTTPCSMTGEASRWLLKRGTGEWAKYDVKAKLKETGVYDPDKVKVQESVHPPKPEKLAYQVADVLKLTGDPAKGKTTAMRCIMCHEIDGQGVNYGPNLKGWGSGQPAEVIVRSIVDPSADIAHGFDGKRVELKDGRFVDGLVHHEGDPTVVTSNGGLTQMIPKGKIKKTHRLDRSLMLSADQLALSAQDVADLTAFLKTYK